MSTPSRITRAERRWLLLASAFVLTLASLPYLVCVWAAGSELTFSGLLMNPADGFAYLAKMRLGLAGDWLYRMPFTLEESQGAFMFSYYLALGHLARIVDLPLPLVFHLARVVNGFLMLWLSYQLIARVTEDIALRRLMWWIVAIGSGLGWLVMKFGLGYSYYYQIAIVSSGTFYALLNSVHTLLTMALMLMIFIAVLETEKVPAWRMAVAALLSLLLGVLNPIIPLMVDMILGGALLAIWWRDRVFPTSRFIAVVVAGLCTAPLLIYMLLAIDADPSLRAFAAGNVNLTPSPVGLLLSYGLLWLLLIPGLRIAWQRRSDWDLLLIAWIVLMLPMAYFPYQLQLRFLTGWQIPLAILAALGLNHLVRSVWLRGLVVAVLASTSLYLLLHLTLSRGSVSTALVHYPLTYLTAAESDVLRWLRENAPPKAAVLGSQRMGLLIPAFAGQRVVFGHVYETVDAPRKRQLVEDFFAARLDQQAMLMDLGIDYLVVQESNGTAQAVDVRSLPLRLVHSAGDLSVYRVERQ